MYRDVFRRPAALGYLTESERQMVQARFTDRPLLEDVTGIGVDMPQHHRYPGAAGAPGAETPGGEERDAPADGEPPDTAPQRERGSHLNAAARQRAEPGAGRTLRPQQRRPLLRRPRRICRMSEAARCRRTAARCARTERARVHPAALPVGCCARQIRADLRESQEREVTRR